MDGVLHALNVFGHTTFFRGAVGGTVSAALVDLHALLKMNGWQDLYGYSWGTASFRWAIGALSGGLTGAGYGAMIG